KMKQTLRMRRSVAVRRRGERRYTHHGFGAVGPRAEGLGGGPKARATGNRQRVTGDGRRATGDGQRATGIRESGGMADALVLGASSRKAVWFLLPPLALLRSAPFQGELRRASTRLHALAIGDAARRRVIF